MNRVRRLVGFGFDYVVPGVKAVVNAANPL